MNETEQAIVSVAQTMLRHQYTDRPIGRDEIGNVVDQCGLLFGGLTNESRARIIDELETRIVIKIGKPTKLVDGEGHVPWYFGDRKAERRYFQRYVDFLQQVEQWPRAAIDAL